MLSVSEEFSPVGLVGSGLACPEEDPGKYRHFYSSLHTCHMSSESIKLLIHANNGKPLLSLVGKQPFIYKVEIG